PAEPRGDGERVGRAHPALGQPRPRESIGITEVQRAPEPAPAVGAIEESELPVVDVEDQRPWATAAGEEAEAEARWPRLRGINDVTVDETQQLGHDPRESRIAPASCAAMRNRALRDRPPERVVELRPDNVDVVARREQSRQELG